MECISPAMRDFLVLHLDQAHVPIIHNFASIPDKFERRRIAWQAKSREAALRQGWVRITTDRRFTVMVEKGRMALASALAGWADAIEAFEAAAEPKSDTLGPIAIGA